MNDKLVAIKAAIAAVLTAIGAFLGWKGIMMIVWVAAMALDYLTGTLSACKGGEWSSSVAREGLWHKGGMIVIVCVACAADWLLGAMLKNLPGVTLPFEYTVLVGPLVVMWYIIGELGSLAEHGVSMGAPVPAWLVRFLRAGKKAVDAAGDKISPEEDENG